jgi:riboflavin kinase/FMN adenylyltransferase
MRHKVFGLKNNMQQHALGLGVFDGLHLGHQVIAKRADQLLTFYPHPDIFFGKSNRLKMLTTLRELRFYSKKLLVVRFDKEIASMKPQDFLNELILKYIKPKSLVVGYDFKFGYKKTGDIKFLLKWAKEKNIEIDVVPAVKADNKIIKSQKIRTLFDKDCFNAAVKFLGHSYLIIGKVITGDKRGRGLGFPTANLKVPKHKLIPQNGVYVGKVFLENMKYKALVNIGTRPTFKTHHKTIEVHILDYKGDLYNKQIKVFLEKKIRNEEKFFSKEKLIEQIKKDILNYK